MEESLFLRIFALLIAPLIPQKFWQGAAYGYIKGFSKKIFLFF